MAFMLSAEDLHELTRIAVEGFTAGYTLVDKPSCPYPEHWWDGIVWKRGYDLGQQARHGPGAKSG